MKIVINGAEYQLTEDQQHIITSLFHAKIEAEYSKLEPTWRLAAKAIARGALDWIENRVKQERGIEAAVRVRPAKKADPVPHLLNIGEHLLVDMIGHVTISFRTNEFSAVSEGGPGTIEDFACTITPKDSGQDGRPMDSHGHVGIRQNDSPEVSGQHVYETVS